MHHIRPSVDYAWLFSSLEPRGGEEIKNAHGKVIAKVQSGFSTPPVQYRFQDLYAAFSEYLDALVAMLQDFSRIDILRR